MRFSSKGGTAIRSTQEVVQYMSEPIRRRSEIAASISLNDKSLSMQQRVQRFAMRPLREEDMEAAAHRWIADFEDNDMHEWSKRNVLQWRNETHEAVQNKHVVC